MVCYGLLHLFLDAAHTISQLANGTVGPFCNRFLEQLLYAIYCAVESKPQNGLCLNTGGVLHGASEVWDTQLGVAPDQSNIRGTNGLRSPSLAAATMRVSLGM